MKKIVALILTVFLALSCVVFICVADGEGNYPQITDLTPISGGFKINYTACDDAVSYRVFSKSDSGWKALGTTTETSFECKNLKDKTQYTFTVRGLDENGEYSTDFDSQGFSQTYYNPPKLSSLTCAQAGLKLTWDKIDGIDYYKVFLKTADGWKFSALTNQNSFTDTSPVSGKVYTYTVKGVNADGSVNLTYHDVKGISAKFVAAPKITAFTNLANGTKITWNKCAGASAYRVFMNTSKGWKKLADTTSCTYTHKNLKNNFTYIYTVRAIDKAGKYVSACRIPGSYNTFFSVPKLTGAVPAYGGMKVSWNKVAGVKEYTVFRKSAEGWKKIAVCNTNTYTDKNVASGKQYTYTVRCSKDSGKTGISWYNSKGIKGTYVAAPQITGFENLNNSVKINVKKSAGAYSYRFFIKTAKGWKAFSTSKALSATHKGVKNNTLYTYTVRAIGKNGKYVSAAAPGTSNRFFAPPAITSVTFSETGSTVEWNNNTYISNYRLYKKTYGGSWTSLADTTQNSYKDESVENGKLYTYTLRYLDTNKKPISYALTNTKYYYNGALANGKINYAGKTLNFTNGLILKGLVKQNGKYYFYNSEGILQKNGIVGNSKTGYYYANKNGVIDMTFRDGIKYKNTLWIVQNGKAKKVTTEYDKTLYRAFVMVRACTNKSMTKEQKLLASFRYIQKITVERNPRIPHYTGKNWHLIYANDIFVNKTGNCMSYGAAFAFMAKAIGYTDVYCCNSGGHGWAEVNHLVYDPEWDIHHKNSFYAISYDAKCGNDYKGAISAGYWWMRVKI